MKLRKWSMFGVVFCLVALAAVFLDRLQSLQLLGQPGIKVVAEPALGEDDTKVGTHRVWLPERVPDFSSQPTPITKAEIDWLPADTTYGRRLYSAEDGFDALVTVVLMGTDRTSIHKPQICLTGQGWVIQQSQVIPIRIERPWPYDLEVMRLIAEKQTADAEGRPVLAKAVFVYWFVADGALTPHHGERMWWMARELIARQVLQRWAYVTYFSVCSPGMEAAAFERLRRLIIESVPQYQLATGSNPAAGSAAAPISSLTLGWFIPMRSERISGL